MDLNPIRVEIGGRSWPLAFHLAAMAELQKALGETSLQGILLRLDALQPPAGTGADEHLLQVNLDDLQAFLWAGIRGGTPDEDITPERVGRSIRLRELPTLIASLNLALLAQFAEPPAAADNQDAPPLPVAAADSPST